MTKHEKAIFVQFILKCFISYIPIGTYSGVYNDLILFYFKLSIIIPTGLDGLLGYFYVADLEMER